MNKITITVTWDTETEIKLLEKALVRSVAFVRGEIYSISWMLDGSYRMDYNDIDDLFMALNEGCNSLQIIYTP
ncbi:MAG: hypothetical protein EAZ13_01120 [Sphingobacteriia bacterium]|nr:MAG: hypothetical protein EAZ35_00555 [Sphingobacteriia bacterium]TAH09373.1 MAG: hypothetical protein EAZ13_01120 [Sphingobacteriia bacterium]